MKEKKIHGIVAMYVPEEKDITYMPLHREDPINHFLGGVVMERDTHQLKYKKRFIVGFLETNKMFSGDIEDEKEKEFILEMDKIKKMLSQFEIEL